MVADGAAVGQGVGRAGELRLEHHQVAPVDVPDIQIVAYLPVPDSGAAEGLRRLLG